MLDNTISFAVFAFRWPQCSINANLLNMAMQTMENMALSDELKERNNELEEMFLALSVAVNDLFNRIHSIFYYDVNVSWLLSTTALGNSQPMVLKNNHFCVISLLNSIINFGDIICIWLICSYSLKMVVSCMSLRLNCWPPFLLNACMVSSHQFSLVLLMQLSCPSQIICFWVDVNCLVNCVSHCVNDLGYFTWLPYMSS